MIIEVSSCIYAWLPNLIYTQPEESIADKYQILIIPTLELTSQKFMEPQEK